MLPNFLKNALLKLVLPKLEKILLAELPIAPPSRTRLPIVSKLPGNIFDPTKVLFGSCARLPSGNFLLKPGDYLIPVMTYCMKSNAGSPSHHRYQLATLSGSKSTEVEILNRRAPQDFDVRGIQELSWAIQHGIPFEQMSKISQQIIMKIMPELKKNFEEDFLTKAEKNWDSASKFIPSAPSFQAIISLAIGSLGETGEVIQNIISLRQNVLNEGARYETFAGTISSSGKSNNLGDQITTPWSRVQKNIFARFITEGSYGDPAVIQVRVSSASGEAAQFNPYLLVADPGTSAIQPLSISTINPAWILALPFLPEELLIALLAFSIAMMDWESIINALKRVDSAPSPNLQKILDEANQLLSEKHDEIEKPARDLGILDDAKEITEGGKDGARNYEKTGGADARDRDFNKFPGQEIDRSSDG